ncbi:MAG: hypothetical protein ACLVKR_06430 [Lachnospiraceae bacterium]
MGRLQKLKTAKCNLSDYYCADMRSRFVAQSVATELMDLSRLMEQSADRGIVLLPIIAYSDAKKKKEGIYVKMTRNDWRTLLIGGSLRNMPLRRVKFTAVRNK